MNLQYSAYRMCGPWVYLGLSCQIWVIWPSGLVLLLLPRIHASTLGFFWAVLAEGPVNQFPTAWADTGSKKTPMPKRGVNTETKTQLCKKLNDSSCSFFIRVSRVLSHMCGRRVCRADGCTLPLSQKARVTWKSRSEWERDGSILQLGMRYWMCHLVQSSPKEWALGCVNSSPRPGHGIT